MCEPISLTICACVIICFCCVGIAMAATVLPALGMMLHGALEVLACVNETTHEDVQTVQKSTACAEASRQNCWEQAQGEEGGAPGGDWRRLQSDAGVGNSTGGGEDGDDAGCKELIGKCVCNMAKTMVEKKEPTFKQSINGCCSSLEDMSHGATAEMGQGMLEVCHAIVDNVTDMVNEIHDNCSNGIFPANGGLLQGGLQSGEGQVSFIQEKFSVLHDVSPLGTRTTPAAALGGGAALMVAAAMVLRRRSKIGRDAVRASPLVDSDSGRE